MSPLILRAVPHAGPVGAKRTDIVETLFGIREKSSGTITFTWQEKSQSHCERSD